MRNDLSVDIIWDLFNKSQSHLLDCLCLQGWKRSQDLRRTRISLAHILSKKNLTHLGELKIEFLKMTS